MSTQRHLIKKATLHLQVSKDGLLSQAQRTCRNLILEKALPALDAAFSEACPDNHWLLIDKLEIDLGTLPIADLEMAFEKQLLKKLKEALQARQSDYPPIVSANAAAGQRSDAGVPPRQDRNNQSTAEDRLLERWLLFLQSGFFDWRGVPQIENLDPESSFVETAKAWHSHQWQSFEDLWLGNPTAFVRLFLGFSNEKLISWIKCWETAYAAMGVSVAEALESAFFRLSADPTLWANFGAQIASRLRTLFPTIDWDAIIMDNLNTRNITPAGHLSKRNLPDMGTGRQPNQGISAAQGMPQQNLLALEEGAEPIFVENAGLVLMHVFIPSLFAKTGIVNDDGFLDEKARQKGLALLHFLSSGKNGAPEYALPLFKILCDCPLQWPNDPNLVLEDAEVAEANACLKAAIEHWGGLGSASPAALREGFLHRPGKLFARPDGGWLLQVEAKTIDVLMNSLPWGVGMVRFPWMPHFLMVEWKY